MSDRKRTLSHIDRLPLEEALWVFDRIQEYRLTQLEIVDELNGRLKQKNIKPVSVSALNRWALRVRDDEVSRPRAISGEKPADDLLAGINLSIETHAAFKVFLNLYARDIRSEKETS